MHFLDKRVNVICEELKKLKVKQKFTIDNWKYKEGNFIRPEEAEADNAAWEDFDCQNMHWYGKDRHYWFKTTYQVPHELDGKRMWLHVRTQIDEWDDEESAVSAVCERGSGAGHRYEPQGCLPVSVRKGG